MVEIQFDLSQIFPSEPIQRLDRGMLNKFHPRKYWAVEKAIDKLGELSTKAQGLKRVITSYQKILDQEEEHIIYLMWNKANDSSSSNTNSQLIGLLKVGRKRLYLRDEEEKPFEEVPLCILDFYVYEPMQRKGHGHQLYEYMLQAEDVSAQDVAIDRPSDAFLQFLEKYYSLTKPIWQATNYVVYPAFFKEKRPTVADELKGGTRREAYSEKVVDNYVPSKDSASGIIHGTARLQIRPDVSVNSPTGRKNTRDFGHQSIW